jgi:hypothetical protein
MSTPRRQRIRVSTRQVQGGMEFKFEPDPYDVKLHGILSPEDYTETIDFINRKIKPARANSIDGMLLATGPLLVPLALWGVRHGWQVKKRKRLLQDAIREFNETHPHHWMRWNRGGPESFLTIELRQQQEEEVAANADGFRDPPPNRHTIHVPAAPAIGNAVV